ncbi:MAG: sigma-70 family RNA polymerase sigma factor [Mucilaginibacter sp.]
MRELQINPSITNRETRAVERYFGDIAGSRLLNIEEEVELAQKIRQGDQAALERLALANLRFVVSVAKRYQHLGLPLSDLISEGNIGLIRAARRYDETRGFKFISFAVWWIRQSILSALSEHTRMIRLPMNQVNLLARINRLQGKLESGLERQPTGEELSELSETDVLRIREARLFLERSLSYDKPMGEEDNYTLLDMLSDPERRPDSWLDAEDDRHRAGALLALLPPRERQVLELCFGLNGENPLPPRDIAAVMGISGERVRQLKKAALDMLRQQGKMHWALNE